MSCVEKWGLVGGETATADMHSYKKHCGAQVKQNAPVQTKMIKAAFHFQADAVDEKGKQILSM